MAVKRKVKRKKNSNSGFGVTSALVIFVAVIVIWGYARYSPTVTTKVAYQGEIKDTIEAKGMAIFEEELMKSDKKGVSIVNYADGTRVVAKTHVATLYSGDVDDGKSTQISELNEKINYLETNMKNLQNEKTSEESLNNNLISKIKEVSYYSVSGNFESIQRENSEIESIIATSNTGDLTKQLETLKTQRDDVERTITGSKEEYLSRSAGVIYSTLDGYETTITTKTTEDLDVNGFKNLWGGKEVNYQTAKGSYIYGKIINNFYVTVASLVDSKDIEGMKAGETIYIRFPQRTTDSVPATIQSIKASGSQSVVMLYVTEDVESFLAERKFSFQFIKHNFKGLKIPTEAIKKDGNKTSVLVVKDSVVFKKNVEVLGEKEDYTIVKENNSDSNSLLLYDLVITHSKNVSVGQVISDYK